MAANDAKANSENRDRNWLVWNNGVHAMTGFNFLLRVEGVYDLPCRSIKGFHKEEEYETIQEGGVNDYVHSLRKPISKPFTLEIERYVGVDYIDPLPLGAEPILPIILFVSTKPIGLGGLKDAIRTYTFTGCKVQSKDFGELNAENSSLVVERTTIIYREMLYVTLPDVWFNHDKKEFKEKYKDYALTVRPGDSKYPDYEVLTSLATYLAMKEAGVKEVEVEVDGVKVKKKIDEVIKGYTSKKKTTAGITDAPKDNKSKYLSFSSYKKAESGTKNLPAYNSYEDIVGKVKELKDEDKYLPNYNDYKDIMNSERQKNNKKPNNDTKYKGFKDIKDDVIEMDNTSTYPKFGDILTADSHRTRNDEVNTATKEEMERYAAQNIWPRKSHAKKLSADSIVKPEEDTREKFESYNDFVNKAKSGAIPGKNESQYKGFKDIETGNEEINNTAKYPNFSDVKDDNIEADNTSKYPGFGKITDSDSHRNRNGEIPTPSVAEMEALAKKNSWPAKRNAKTIASILSGDKK